MKTCFILFQMIMKMHVIFSKSNGKFNGFVVLSSSTETASPLFSD